MTAAHDFECYRRGWSELPRHPFTCLGPGAWHNWSHADGVGSVCLNEFILVQGDDGRFCLLDFNTMAPDHKAAWAIMGQLGFGTDKEVVNFLMNGTCWKVPNAPRQLRIGHNVVSLKSRARGVGEATAKLIDKGLYRAVRVMREGQALDDASRSPAFCLPQYSVGMGGADKTDKPDEKRPTSNTSDPHKQVRARNKPHGEPDGDVVTSFNDLTGPRHVPRDYCGPPLPFPDRETKCTSREVYAGDAYVCALARINNTTACAAKHDVRWCFFQFLTRSSEYWLSIEYLVIGVCSRCDRFFVLCVCAAGPAPECEVLYLFRIMPLCINMGTRPASKIAVRFAQKWNEEWRCRMADHVLAEWLPRQSTALKRVLAERERRLGYEQAHPFVTFEFTDDFYESTPDVRLTAKGARIRETMAREAGIWMSSKRAAGTLVEYIGGIHVLSGAFGTISAAKRARSANEIQSALDDKLTRAEYVACNSFTVHAVDLLNIDHALLQGIWAPSKRVTNDAALVILSLPENAVAAAQQQLLLVAVQTRPAAAFTTGIVDAPIGVHPSDGVPSAQPTVFLRMSSDCRADGEAMTIFGRLLEFEWGPIRLADIDARWRHRHVTVGESSGAAVNVAIFGSAFPGFELIHEGDNTTEGPMLLGRAKQPDQVQISLIMRRTRGFQHCRDRLWWEHSAGLGLGFTDAGSREYISVLANLAAAFGLRRVRLNVEAMPEIMHMLHEILEATSEYVKKPRSSEQRAPPSFRPSASDLRAIHPAEVGLGVCASNPMGNSASHVCCRPRLRVPACCPFATTTAVRGPQLRGCRLRLCAFRQWVRTRALLPPPPLCLLPHPHQSGARMRAW